MRGLRTPWTPPFGASGEYPISGLYMWKHVIYVRNINILISRYGDVHDAEPIALPQFLYPEYAYLDIKM